MNFEKQVGIQTFLTENKGIGGKLRYNVEDFIVDEISINPTENNGKYIIAKIKARNWETFRLVNEISKKLKISRRIISFAGTKDKRAITTQLFSIISELEKVKQLNISDVEVLEAYSSDKKIKIGDLIGNRFHIVIREIDKDYEEIKEEIEDISNKIINCGGFPNFFGIQRFGSIRPITHIVGKKIINQDFKEAVFTYIANPLKTEGIEVIKVRKFVQETKDFTEALNIYPKFLSFERSMIHHLKNHPDDYIGALNKLPKNLVLMFIHAYQSYLFNKMISERMKQKLPIHEPIIGDICLPIEKHGLVNRRDLIEVSETNYPKVKKKVKEGKASISCILFGYKTEFSRGEQGEIERKIIEKEGIKPEDFIIPQMKEFSSKGSRREIIAPLKKIDWKVKENVEFDFQLTKGCYATSLLREFMKCEDIMSY